MEKWATVVQTHTHTHVFTFPLQEQPEQRAGSGDGLVVVVVIVDGQQVAVHVGVSHQQLHVGDTVHVLQEAVELIETARFGAVQGETTELGAELGWKKKHVNDNDADLRHKGSRR